MFSTEINTAEEAKQFIVYNAQHHLVDRYGDAELSMELTQMHALKMIALDKFIENNGYNALTFHLTAAMEHLVFEEENVKIPKQDPTFKFFINSLDDVRKHCEKLYYRYYSRQAPTEVGRFDTIALMECYAYCFEYGHNFLSILDEVCKGLEAIYQREFTEKFKKKYPQFFTDIN
jgi:hypothetical protein